MESNRISGDDARRSLDLAAADRAALAEAMSLPPGYSLMTGTGNALFAFGIALGNSHSSFGTVAFVLGITAQAILAAQAMRRFKDHNGAWVGGMAGPKGTRLVIIAFVAGLVPCVVGSTWLMVAGRPVLSALVAAAALPLTAASDRWWMSRYRRAR